MEQNVKDILKTIDDAIDGFQGAMPAVQKQLFNELQPLIKELGIKNGKILNDVTNLKLIGEIQNKLKKIITTSQYKDQVQKFIDSFSLVSSLQLNYFKQFNQKYTPNKTLPIVKQLAIESTINDLLGEGMNNNILDPIKSILNQNITTGGSYADFNEQLRDWIIGNDKAEGNILKYTKQITTDAIRHYSRQYNAIIAQDLNFNWNQYVGSLRTTSREFCIYLTEKRWVHNSELPIIIAGDIDGHECKLSKVTGLPIGMMPGTNADNFKINCGGYECHHSYWPVPDSSVPAQVLLRFTGKNNDLPVNVDVLLKNNQFNSEKDFVEKNNGDLHNELSLIEKAAIYNYSSSGYRKLNRYLRGDEGPHGVNTFSEKDNVYFENLSNSLDNALNKIDANYKGTVYRGVELPEENINQIKQALESNSIYSDPAFISTTYAPGLSSAGHAQFIITSKTGKLIESLTKYGIDEKEVLFNRNTPFLIKSIEQKNDNMVIFMEEV